MDVIDQVTLEEIVQGFFFFLYTYIYMLQKVNVITYDVKDAISYLTRR